MGKLLIYLLCVLLLIGANNIVNYQLNEKQLSRIMQQKYSFGDIAKDGVSPKLVLIGSSTTKTGYSLLLLQQILSLSEGQILNLATMPNNAELNYFLIKRYIKDIPGSIVVYGVDPWIFSERYYSNFSYKFSGLNLSQRLALLSDGSLSVSKKLAIMNGGDLFDNLSTILIPRQNILDYKSQETDWHGLDARAKVPVAQWFEYPRFRLSQDFMNSLRMLDELCTEQGCTLLVYSPAYSQSFGRDYQNIQFRKDFEQGISSTLKSGVHYTALSTLPDSLFWDGIHVNEAGKIVQTKRLAGIISNQLFGLSATLGKN